MSIGKKEFTIKAIDELGNVVTETMAYGLGNRRNRIRQWINGDKYYRADNGDVQILVKDNGEELWIYEGESYGDKE